MKRVFSIAALAAAVLLSGCTEITSDLFKTDKYRLMSPDKIIRKPDRAPINPILPSIGMVDQTEDLVPGATFPRPGDWTYAEEDYVIGARDVVDIGVQDLYTQGLETVLRREVSETGFIDLPLVEQRVKAAGRTAEDLKDAIRDAYSPNILRDPQVSVSVVARRQDTFSMLGAVARPGTYNLVRRDMRLLEALAMAGGITQANIRYIYVIRQERARPGGDKRPEAGADGGLPVLPPLPEIPEEEEDAEAQPDEEKDDEQDDVDRAMEELGDLMPGTAPAPSVETPRLNDTGAEGAAAPAESGADPKPQSPAGKDVKWVYSNGRWVPVARAKSPTATQPGPADRTKETPKDDPFGWAKMQTEGLSRIVAINLNKLRQGDPRMNVVIRDNDVVQIPTLEIGEFYVMGEVARPGVYSLTGRKVTAKMALAAAGNLAPLAWPENSVLIRRVGNNQEQLIPLDLEAIFRGDQPDVFLKPNDVLAIGTSWQAPFMAVLRNAFRFTYGFGFIWDRNFAEYLPVTPTSDRFTRL